VTINASVSLTVGGVALTRDTDPVTLAPSGPGGTGPATKVFVDAQIGLSPLSDTNGVTENHTVTVSVDQNDGLGGGFVDAPVGHVDVALTNSGGAAFSIDTALSTCDDAGDNLDANGQCTIVFTSPSAGTVTINASVSLTVGGVALTRDTDPVTLAPSGPGGTGPATKVFVDGTLRWLKHDQDGILLGGAVFEVCRTHNFNSTTGEFDDITPDVCLGSGDPLRIADDVEAPGGAGPNADNDETPGEFQLSGLVLGRYTIRETSPPPGFAGDPNTVRTVELTVSNPSNADNDPAVPIFVNERLYRVIVITCNDSVSPKQLVDSTVTMGGMDFETIQSDDLLPLPAFTGVDPDELCNLPGATKGGLATADAFPVTVELPDDPPLFPGP
jgi:Prealbumin-like fold domain